MGSPGKNTGVGCHFLLQGILLTLGSNLHPCVSWLAGGYLTICTTWEIPYTLYLWLVNTWWRKASTNPTHKTEHSILFFSDLLWRINRKEYVHLWEALNRVVQWLWQQRKCRAAHRWEELPHIQDQGRWPRGATPQHFDRAAVKRDPVSKIRETR